MKNGFIKIAVITALLVWGAAPVIAGETADPRIEELRRLKRENPGEFYRVTGERKRHIREKMMELKERDPQKFEEVKRQLADKRFHHLKRLRVEDPERYREIMRDKVWKLEELRRSDPERFSQCMTRHPGAARRFEHWQFGQHPRKEYRPGAWRKPWKRAHTGDGTRDGDF